jgi:VWFA-related protein
MAMASDVAVGQVSVFRARTELAVISVSVRDRQGRTLVGLTPDRFELREDDKPRPVVAAATGAEPLSLVIALDASESMKGARFQYAREAVSAFFAARNPEDEFHLVGFNERVVSLVSNGQSIDAVQRVLDLVEPAGTTALYDAVIGSISLMRQAKNRRRAVVVISDGRDASPGASAAPGSQYAIVAFERLSRTLERVQRSEAMLYAIGINAPLPKGVPPAPDKEFDANSLRQLTNVSAGLTIVATTNEGVPVAAKAIVDDLREQYVLGFEPARPDDGKFHRVTVRVRDCDRCNVRARRGYVATGGQQ